MGGRKGCAGFCVGFVITMVDVLHAVMHYSDLVVMMHARTSVFVMYISEFAREGVLPENI